VIEGFNLPGLTCPPDTAGEHHDVHIALYTESSSGPRWSYRGRLRLQRAVRARRTRRPPPRLAWGDVHDDGTLRLIRSSKLRLVDIDPRVVEEAMRPGHRLVARILLTDTQRKPALTWSARPVDGKPG
jgi:hypothetical protein